MNRIGLIILLNLLCLLSFPGCGSLGLQTETSRVSGKRYIFFRPWIHYTVRGSGKPLVLVHDLLTDSHTWRYNVEQLSEYFQVFTLDLPGFGRSINPYDNFTLEYYSSTVGLFLKEMDLGDAVVIGHGMGAAVALDAYLRFPERVQSVVVINSVGFDTAGEILERDRDRIGIALFNSEKELDLDRLRKEVLEASLGNLYVNKKLLTKELIEHYMEPLLHQEGRSALLGTLRYFKTDGLMERLIAAEADLMSTRKMDRRGERTVLVIWGTEDVWYPPRTAEYFRARIPRCKVAIIKGAGHFPHEEEPEVVNGLLLDTLLSRPVQGNQYRTANYDATSLLEEGRKLKRRKKFEEAKDKFKAAIEFNPYLGIAFYEIGDMLFAEKHYAEAIEMLKESLRIYPHNAQVHYRLGTTYHNQATTMAARWEEQGMDAEFIEENVAPMVARGIRHYEQAGRLDPKLSNAWFNLGRLYEEAGDYKEVSRVYGKLSEAKPQDLRAGNLYIQALVKAKDMEQAVYAIGRVEKIKSERGKGTWPSWRGKILMDLGHWEDAVKAWQRATDLEPANPDYNGYMAMALAENGKPKEARESLDVALRGDPGNPVWHMLAGDLDMHEGEWDKAVEHFRAALMSQPDDLKAAVGLATSLVHMDELQEPAKVLERFIQKGEHDTDLLVARARVHSRQAEVLSKEARKRKESREEVKAALSLLQQAYAKGYDCRALGQDPDFGFIKKDRAFRAFRRRLR